MNFIFDHVLSFRKKWEATESGMIDVPFPLRFEADVDKDLARQYISFVREELTEIEDALDDPDLSVKQKQQAVGDGLCDAMVFLVTLIIRLGYLYIFKALYGEVSRSNETKGHDGKLFDDSGKMIKGPGYERPDFGDGWADQVKVTGLTADTIAAKLMTREATLNSIGLVDGGWDATTNTSIFTSVDDIPPFHRVAHIIYNHEIDNNN